MHLTFRLPLSIDLVFDYLTDMQKFVTVHPVIDQIDPTGQETYLVHETLKFGFIPFSFTYPVEIEKNVPGKTITIRATVSKITKITMKFSLQPAHGAATVNEPLHFDTLLAVMPTMESAFKKQHHQLFRGLLLKVNEGLQSVRVVLPLGHFRYFTQV